MEQIKFYLTNIDPNVVNTIGGRSGELIQLIRTGSYISEEALARQLYEGKWEEQNYRNLKARTKRILMAFFLVSPPKKSSETKKKIIQCRISYLSGMSFIESGRRPLARKLMQQVYEDACEYGFTKLAYDSVVELLADASLELKAKKLNQYSNQADSLLLDLRAEHAAQKAYYKLIFQMNRKQGIKQQALMDYTHELQAFTSQSTKFLHYFYIICIIRDLNARDYLSIKRITSTALQRLKDRKGVYGSFLQHIKQTKAIAHTALKEFDQAEQLFEEAEQFAPPRSLNLGIIICYKAINALHCGDYQKAYQLYRNNRRNKYKLLQEQWAIMGAYFYYLKSIGQLDTGVDRFSLGKYLNETAPNAHDKTGSNINILIGELLVYLVKNRGKFIDRVEAITTYSYKYLKERDTQRARWFIRILCLLPRANFHPTALQRIAKRQIANLKNYPIRMGDNFAVEIIPFENLLEALLEQLGRKRA